MDCKFNTDLGVVTVNDEVIVRVAGYAALDCYGIVGMASKRSTDGIVQMMGRENLGRGVSYCATCDAALYKGKEAVVVGWAPKEESDARFLAELAGKVVYLPVYKRADEEAMKDPLFPDRPNIEVRKDKPKRILKKDGRMVLETESGEIQTDGIFLLRESVSPDKLVPGLELDGNHVKVDRSMATNLPGMFAAGDITGAPYQYIKAAGEGTAVVSPLPGVIIEVSVKEGQAVKKGQKVAVIEAMKMENEIPALADGTVTSIKVSKGDSILEGDTIVTIG